MTGRRFGMTHPGGRVVPVIRPAGGVPSPDTGFPPPAVDEAAKRRDTAPAAVSAADVPPPLLVDTARMPQAPTNLEELHALLRQLDDVREALDRGPRQIKVRTKRVADAEAAVTAAEEELTARRAAVNQRNLELKTRETKVSELKVKLNQASSNKEFDALKGQIAADETASGVLEDEVLEALDRQEAAERAVTEAKSSVETAKQELSDTQTRFESKAQELTSRAETLAELAASADELLPANLRGDFARLRKNMGPDSLAPVEDGICTGCHVQVTPQTKVQLNGGDVLFCRSCNRLMYVAK